MRTAVILLPFAGLLGAVGPASATMWQCAARLKGGEESDVGFGCNKSKSMAEAEAISDCKDLRNAEGKACYIRECLRASDGCPQDE